LTTKSLKFSLQCSATP